MANTLTLTSQKVQPGHLLKNRELVLLVDGKRYDDYLSHYERINCLKKAMAEFDAELQSVAEQFKNHPYGAYLWLYTPDFIRGEEIAGLYRKMYLGAIIRYLTMEKGYDKICIDIPASTYECNFLKQIPIEVTFNRTSIVINSVNNLLRNIKQLYKTFTFNSKSLLQKPNPAFTGALIDTSSRYAKNRYDDIKKVVGAFNNQVKFYSGDQIAVSGCPSDQAIVFKRELTLKIFISSLRESFRISRFIARNKANIPIGLYNNHKGFFKMMLYWDLVLSQKSIDKYLNKSDIKTIVQVSTLTKPVYRSLAVAAKQRNILFVQVASRSLMIYRCSERLLKCDIEEYNKTAIPNWFIFKDKSSTRIFDAYPQIMERVLIGGRFKGQDSLEKDLNTKPVAILLLFNHRKDLSYKLLAEVKASGIQKLVSTIIIRCHPSFVFENKVLQDAFPTNNLIDITGKDYSAVKAYRLLTISGPTTAAMDVIQFGAIVLWASYIWDEGILMEEMMQNVGSICNSFFEIGSQTQAYLNDNLMFYNKIAEDLTYIHKYFTPKVLISEQIAFINLKSHESVSKG